MKITATTETSGRKYPKLDKLGLIWAGPNWTKTIQIVINKMLT